MRLTPFRDGAAALSFFGGEALRWLIFANNGFDEAGAVLVAIAFFYSRMRVT